MPAEADAEAKEEKPLNIYIKFNSNPCTVLPPPQLMLKTVGKERARPKPKAARAPQSGLVINKMEKTHPTPTNSHTHVAGMYKDNYPLSYSSPSEFPTLLV